MKVERKTTAKDKQTTQKTSSIFMEGPKTSDTLLTKQLDKLLS
jgi:hypothetical protein